MKQLVIGKGFLRGDHFHGVALKYGDFNMTKKSKKEKAEGREKHRQALREKKMKKKEKKKVTIPAKYKKK